MLDGDTESVEVESQSLLLGRGGGGGGRQRGGKEGRKDGARWITSFSLIVLSRGTPREIEWRIGGGGPTPSSFLSYNPTFLLSSSWPRCISECE